MQAIWVAAFYLHVYATLPSYGTRDVHADLLECSKRKHKPSLDHSNRSWDPTILHWIGDLTVQTMNDGVELGEKLSDAKPEGDCLSNPRADVSSVAHDATERTEEDIEMKYEGDQVDQTTELTVRFADST